ncbi:MAG: hypothetical protein ABIV25_06715 [Paracoccaceae bacterium]
MRVVSAVLVILASTVSIAAGQTTGLTYACLAYDSVDVYDFSNPQIAPGRSGTASLGYFADPGNREATAFSVGGRLRYAANQIAQNITFKLDLAEAKAMKRRKELFAVYDVTLNLHRALWVRDWPGREARARRDAGRCCRG